MKVIKEVLAIAIQFGGEEHQGWLPKGAATPLPTPIEVLTLAFRILENEGDGFILEWAAKESDRCGDTWHRTIDEAERYAEEYFGVRPSHWVPPAPKS